MTIYVNAELSYSRYLTREQYSTVDILVLSDTICWILELEIVGVPVGLGLTMAISYAQRLNLARDTTASLYQTKI